MKRDLTFLPEVSRDFIEAFNYYESLSPGRGGARFEAAFKEAVEHVKAGVVTHACVFGQFHRVFLPRFPYSLYYRLVQDCAVIAGVLYARFDPRKIERALRQRVR